MSSKSLNSICRICRNGFYIKPWCKRKGWGKYCSVQCRNKSQRKGRLIRCDYCGKQIYKSLSELQKLSKTNKYFCNKSCHCAWKNKHRKKKPKVKLNTFVSKPIKKERDLIRSKRPSKKILHNLYWQENKSQSEISDIFNISHTTARRWLKYYNIEIKGRTLSCGKNPNSLRNLKLGQLEENQKKSAQSRVIYSKEKIIKKIEKFTQKNNRIPTRREFSNSPLYPDYRTVRDFFETWNNAIEAAGYNPNVPLFSPNPSGKRLKSKDGHECNSISEVIIDDWLYENNISHQREVLYPEGRYKCDFVINNIFVEFFGLAGVKSIKLGYKEIMEIKRELCKKHNITLVEFYQEDLFKLDEVFEKKFLLKENISHGEILHQRAE